MKERTDGIFADLLTSAQLSAAASIQPFTNPAVMSASLEHMNQWKKKKRKELLKSHAILLFLFVLKMLIISLE